MSFSGLKLTDAGRCELARAECGEKFCITDILFGEGRYEGAPSDITELAKPVLTLPVTQIKRKDAEVTLECDFNSMDLPKAFYWREIGIIANEKLCYYDNSLDNPEYLDPQSDMVIKQKRLKIILMISSEIEVNVSISSSLYVLRDELKPGAYAEIINNDTTTESGYIADARIVAEHGREIDALEESLNTLVDELYNAATESDIDKIINDTYTDTEENVLTDMATERDIDEIIGGTYTGTEENFEMAVYEEIDQIVDKTF